MKLINEYFRGTLKFYYKTQISNVIRRKNVEKIPVYQAT